MSKLHNVSITLISIIGSKLNTVCSEKNSPAYSVQAEWSAFRASCLSNLAGIVLVLEEHAIKYCSRLVQTAMGIIVHEPEGSREDDHSVILVRRGAVYLLRAVATVGKVTLQPIVSKEQYLSMAAIFERLALESVDVVTKYHCGIALDDLRKVVFVKDGGESSSPFLIETSPHLPKPLIEVVNGSDYMHGLDCTLVFKE